MLWYEKGGSGPHAILLLQGLGATSVLARGEGDARVSTAELRLHCQESHEIAAAGHNARVEKHDEIVGLLARLIQQ